MLDMAWIYFMTFMVWLTGSHSALHEHYEQALMTVIQTVAIKDNIPRLLRSILELYTGGGGVEDAEQGSDRASRLSHLIRCCLHCWPKWSWLDLCESCCLDFVSKDSPFCYLHWEVVGDLDVIFMVCFWVLRRSSQANSESCGEAISCRVR